MVSSSVQSRSRRLLPMHSSRPSRASRVGSSARILGTLPGRIRTSRQQEVPSLDKHMTMDVRGDTLVVSVTGDRPASDADARDELIARWYRVAEACALHGLTRVLFVSSGGSRG